MLFFCILCARSKTFQEKKIKTDDVEIVYEKLIRSVILKPNLKEQIKFLNYYLSGQMFFISNSVDNRRKFLRLNIQLPIIENNLAPRNYDFIKRQINIDLSEIIKKEKCVCVQGLIGVGKRELVYEIAHRLIENKSFDVVYAFNFDTFEEDFRQFAKELRLSQVENLVRDVRSRLKQLKEKRFLFVFLNVLDTNKIKDYMSCVFGCKNVKLLVTTTNKHLLDGNTFWVKINC